MARSGSSNIRQMPPAAVLGETPDRIGFRVTMVHLGLSADLIPRLNRLGLTSPSRMTALFHIRANPGCSQIELGEFTGLSRPGTMTMVNQLEGNGLVERRAGADARTNALFITPAGQEALARAVEETNANEELFFGVLDRDEQAVLRGLLEKVINGIEGERRRTA